MRILSKLERQKLDIEESKFWDENFITVGVALPFDCENEYANRIFEMFDGNLLSRTYQDKNRLTLTRCESMGGFTSVQVGNIPVRAIVSSSELGDYIPKPGAIYLKFKLPKVHSLYEPSFEKKISGNIKVEIYQSIFQSVYKNFVPLPEFSLENWMKVKASLVNFSESYPKDAMIDAFHTLALNAFFLKLIEFQCSYLFNGRIISLESQFDKYSILEVFPQYQDGLTFECFTAVQQCLKDIRPDLVKSLMKSIRSGKDDTVEGEAEVLPTEREAKLEKLSFTKNALGQFGRQKKLDDFCLLLEALNYEPYAFKQSPEVVKWRKCENADDINFLHLAYSIGEAQWSRLMGVLSMW